MIPLHSAGVNRPLALLFPFLFAGVLHSEDGVNFDYRPATVVVCNTRDPASVELATYYIKQRGIPQANLVALRCETTETISRVTFETEIEQPLRAAFDERKWWETGRVPKDGLIAKKTTMRVIALMQGLPLRIAADPRLVKVDPKTGQPPTPGPLDFDCASVDSELAAFGVLEKPLKGVVNNPYFNGTTAFAHTGFSPMFLVGRIDGPDKAAAKRLIDDAITVEKSGLYGKAYIDLARKTGEGYKMGEDWLINAAQILELKGLPVIMDTWPATLPLNFPMQDCVFYLGWYVDRADGPFLNPAFRFRRGAIACHIHSYSAATIKSDRENWCGPLLSRGACGVLGNVYEPYLPLTAALDVFTDRLVAGFTLAEAAWMSTRALSWMSVVLGDPLYRPFAASPAEGDKKVSPEYKAIRLAMQRWGKPDAAAELTANLQRAAEGLKSPDLYEFIALHSQAGGGKVWPAAKDWFESALKYASDPGDRIRIQLLMADALRRDGETKQATRTLNAIIEKSPAAPEAAAARAWIQQIRESN